MLRVLAQQVLARAIYVIHDVADLDLDPASAAFDVVVSGHSHKPKIETRQGVAYLNPGIAGPSRFRLPITIATVNLAADPLRPTIRQVLE